VGHPPQPGFHWRRGFALSVVNVTGHLLTPRRWGDEGVKGRLVTESYRILVPKKLTALLD